MLGGARVRVVAVLLGAAALGLACAEYVVAPGERAPRGLQLDSAQYTLDEGQRIAIVATVLDQFGAPFTQLPPGIAIAWSSSDTSVARVDTAGVLAAVAAGTAQAGAAVSGAFGEFKVSAPVTVRPLVTGIAAAAGDSQRGTVGQALASRLQVKVTNRLGAGVRGIAVAFAVTGGGGSLDTASATTDSTGLASAGLTLGTVVGPNRVEARTPRLPLAVVAFTAQGQPGAASTLARVSGDAQSATAGTTLGAPLVVRVLDRYGNVVPGVSVAWSAATGGGAMTPAASLSDSLGLASGRWALGGLVGTQTATASVGGVISVTFNATATPVVASVSVTPAAPAVPSGSTQQLTATPKDSSGNPVAGKTATWATSDSTVAKVSATGLVTAAKAGTATVTATVDAASGTATVTVTPGPASTATSQVSVSAATVKLGSAVTFSLSTRDAAGNALTTGGLTVGFTTGGGTSAGTIGPVTDKANGSYTATFTGTAAGTPLTVGATIGGQAVTGALPTVQVLADTVVASVSVTPAVDTIASGTTVQLAATAKNAAGQVLAGKPVTWSSGTPGVAGVDANGLVTGALVGTSVITATVQGVAGTASVTVNAAAVVLVHWVSTVGGLWSTAADWNPARVPTLTDTAVVDAAGSYTVTSAGDSAGGLVVGVATGGRATVQLAGASRFKGNVEVRQAGLLMTGSSVIVGAFRNDGATDIEPGSVIAIDSASGGTAQNFGVLYLEDSSVFNVNRAAGGLLNHGLITPGAGPLSENSNLARATIAGNVTFGTGSAVAIELQGSTLGRYDVLGITGKATLGDTLRVQLSGGFVPSAGQAFTVIAWTSFSGAFGMILLPTLPGGLWQVAYTPFGLVLSVVAGPAANVSVAQGDGQSAPAGTSVAVPPAVRVTDAGGNPVAGVSVTFAVASGGGSISGPATVTTDATGVATVGGWQLGTTPGTNTLTAAVNLPGIAGNPVTFTATGTTPVLTWTGAVSTDWSNPLNWSPALIPAATGDVFIAPATNQPILTGSSAARIVTIQGSGAHLTIGGQTLSATTLNVESDGLLVMTNPADLVIVSGNTDFSGGNESGSLSAGELRIGGNFNEGVNTSAASFAASGTHRTVFNGGALPTVTFVDLTGASSFQDLDISPGAGINIQFDFNGLTVKGTFTSQPTGAATPLLYGLGRSLTAARLQISRLVVNDSPLILNEGAVMSSEQVDSVTFQNFSSSQRQLTMVGIGTTPTPRIWTVNQPVFVPLTSGATGDYIGVRSLAGDIVVNVVGANVTNGPAFTLIVGSVIVNWL